MEECNTCVRQMDIEVQASSEQNKKNMIPQVRKQKAQLTDL